MGLGVRIMRERGGWVGIGGCMCMYVYVYVYVCVYLQKGHAVSGRSEQKKKEALLGNGTSAE